MAAFCSAPFAMLIGYALTWSPHSIVMVKMCLTALSENWLPIELPVILLAAANCPAQPERTRGPLVPRRSRPGSSPGWRWCSG